MTHPRDPLPDDLRERAGIRTIAHANGHKKLSSPSLYKGSGRRDAGQGVAFSSVAELLSKELEPVRWVVPGILPEGVALLAGKPKLGKSWLALGMCVAVASGGFALGNVRVERGAALYLALEDNERRLQSRLRKVLGEEQPPAGLDYTTVCPRLDEGGLEAIAGWLENHPDARLIVLDTMAKIRPRTSGKNVYQEDYEALEKLLPLAAEHNAAIVVVHHLRKQGAADPLDEVNSSIGLTGGVDGALILKRDRTRADASHFVTGLDVEEEKDLALRWSSDVGAWTLAGDAEEYRASQERQEILNYVRAAGGPVRVKEVATGLEKNYKTIAALMQKMLSAGALTSPAYGKYEAANPQLAVEVPTIPTVPTGHTGRQDSPADSHIGSVGTVRTSRKTDLSGVGTPVGTRQERPAGEVLAGAWSLPSCERRHTGEHEHLEYQDEQGAQGYEQDNPAYLSEGAQGAQHAHPLRRDGEASESPGHSTGEDPEGLQEFLAEPPEWLQRQAALHLDAPSERTLKPLCTAVATEVLGDPRRGEEVRPALERVLKEWRAT